MTRQCQSCPSSFVSLSRNARYCLSCRRARHARRQRGYRDEERFQREALDDFTPEQIESAYLRAVWQKNPAKAQRLLAQMRERAA